MNSLKQYCAHSERTQHDDIDWCEFTRPDGTRWHITAATSRYSTYNGDMESILSVDYDGQRVIDLHYAHVIAQHAIFWSAGSVEALRIGGARWVQELVEMAADIKARRDALLARMSASREQEKASKIEVQSGCRPRLPVLVEEHEPGGMDGKEAGPEGESRRLERVVANLDEDGVGDVVEGLALNPGVDVPVTLTEDALPAGFADAHHTVAEDDAAPMVDHAPAAAQAPAALREVAVDLEPYDQAGGSPSGSRSDVWTSA